MIFSRSQRARYETGSWGAETSASWNMPARKDSFSFQLIAILTGWRRAMKDANVVILCACNYPTETAADVLRRNAIRIAELVLSQEHVILLEK